MICVHPLYKGSNEEHQVALKDITTCQCVQNCFARVVTRSRCFSHSLPLLKYLYLFISYHKQHTRLYSLVTPERKLIQLGSFSSDLLLFLEFKQILELGLDRLLHQLYGIQPFVVLGQLNT